jgi:hypothetical protein
MIYFSVLVCIILIALSGWVLLIFVGFVGNAREFFSEIDSSVIVPLLLMLVIFLAFIYGLKKFISILISSVTLYQDHLSFSHLGTFSFKIVHEELKLNDVSLYSTYGTERTRYGSRRYNILVLKAPTQEFKFPYKTTKSIEKLCNTLQNIKPN